MAQIKNNTIEALNKLRLSPTVRKKVDRIRDTVLYAPIISDFVDLAKANGPRPKDKPVEGKAGWYASHGGEYYWYAYVVDTEKNEIYITELILYEGMI